jgi:hypothetical protein
MTKAIITPRIRQVLNTMVPIVPPKTEAEFQALLALAGVREPRSGRPRKGIRARSRVVHIRIPEAIFARVEKVAARKHSTVAKMGQRFYLSTAIGA